MIGASLQTRYRLDRRIAVGGMGSVYEATDERLNRSVAVKILKGELAADPRFVERFRREARAVASLAHPNIANVFDYGEDNDAHFIVMELVQGEDLARLLRASAPLSPDRAAHIAGQMCAALGHAHSAGIVHRDVKPANVIVGPGDRVKVTDFGIARALGAATTLTATGSILGTAQYLSPEQASGGEIGAPCDVYATGIVLYEMLTGTVPFSGDSAIALAMRQISDPVPPPSRLNRAVPPQLDAIVLRATHKSPERRYSDGAEMAAALEGATRSTAGMAGPVPTAVIPEEESSPATRTIGGSAWPAPGDRWDARTVGRIVLTALGVLVFLTVGALIWRLVSDEAPERAAREEQDRARDAAATPEEPTPTDEETSPPSFTIEEGIIGSNAKDTQEIYEEAGFDVEVIPVASAEEKDTVVDVDPDVDSTVTPGVDTITLYASTGKEEEEEDDGDGGPGAPDVPPGQEKKEDDD